LSDGTISEGFLCLSGTQNFQFPLLKVVVGVGNFIFSNNSGGQFFFFSSHHNLQKQNNWAGIYQPTFQGMKYHPLFSIIFLKKKTVEIFFNVQNKFFWSYVENIVHLAQHYFILI
jgi:hypothetical protein